MSSTDIGLSEIQAAKVVDARGSACPGPLLEAKKGIGAIKVGEVLEIWSGDARTKEDIPKLGIYYNSWSLGWWATG